MLTFNKNISNIKDTLNVECFESVRLGWVSKTKKNASP